MEQRRIIIETTEAVREAYRRHFTRSARETAAVFENNIGNKCTGEELLSCLLEHGVISVAMRFTGSIIRARDTQCIPDYERSSPCL